jgi:hypothetical protein
VGGIKFWAGRDAKNSGKNQRTARDGSPATVLDMSLTTPYDGYTRTEDRAESIILFPDESDVYAC